MTLFFSQFERQWQAALGGVQAFPAPGVRVVQRGIVLPLQKRGDCDPALNCYQGGVTDSAFGFVAGLERKKGAPLYNLSCKKSYIAVGVDVRQETVVFGGIIFGHFGHELIDGLTRLWHFARHPEKGLKYVFVTQPGASTQHAEAFFKLAGLRYEILKQPTQFAEVIVPDEAYMTGEGGNAAWLEWFDHIKARVGNPVDGGKVYLTRRQWPAKDGVGEEYFEEFFKGLGYDVVAPEKLSLDEQIRLIAGASHIACTMGTMAHMLAFARTGADVVILLRSPSSVMPAQLAINTLRGFKWRMVDATRNPLPTGQSNGCFFYWPTAGFYRYAKACLGKSAMRPLRIGLDEDEMLVEYLQKWAKRFSDQNNYKYIKERTMQDVVNSLCAFFGDNNGDNA